MNETSPTFSILLPTKNRLELAKSAIETVRQQTYLDWELVVADNCSDEDVKGYIETLNDSRIVYIRSDTPLPVTDNWNRAIDAARGKWIVMLGDDDGLVPGYFERVLTAAEKLEQPDFLCIGAYHFGFPRTIPSRPDGFLIDVTLCQSVLRAREKIGLLRLQQARQLGKRAVNMDCAFEFNMQYFVFNASFLGVLRQFGPIFQGPFPDYYTTMMSMLLAEQIGVLAEPLVVIGISPKSYGFYHSHSRDKEGMKFLGISDQSDNLAADLRAQLLPGSNMNTSWLITSNIVNERLSGKYDFTQCVGRYRLRQIFYLLKLEVSGLNDGSGIWHIWSSLGVRERAAALLIAFALMPARLVGGYLRNAWCRIIGWIIGVESNPLMRKNRPRRLKGHFETVIDVFKFLRSVDHPA